MATSEEYGRVCEHDSLARSCLVCEVTAERDEALARVSDLQTRLGRALDSAEAAISQARAFLILVDEARAERDDAKANATMWWRKYEAAHAEAIAAAVAGVKSAADSELDGDGCDTWASTLLREVANAVEVSFLKEAKSDEP